MGDIAWMMWHGMTQLWLKNVLSKLTYLLILIVQHLNVCMKEQYVRREQFRTTLREFKFLLFFKLLFNFVYMYMCVCDLLLFLNVFIKDNRD